MVRAFREYYFGLTGAAARPSVVPEGAVRADRAGAGVRRLLCAAGVKGWFEWFLGGEPFLHKRKIIRQTAPGENGIGTATQAHYDLVYLRGGQ